MYYKLLLFTNMLYLIVVIDYFDSLCIQDSPDTGFQEAHTQPLHVHLRLSQ